jgi:hypothetical protein
MATRSSTTTAGKRVLLGAAVAVAVSALAVPTRATAAPADGAATFTDPAAFGAALAALGTVSSIVATYDDLTVGAVLADGTAVGGITHDYTGGSALIDLLIRDFPEGGTQTLGTLFDGTFEGVLGFDDAVTFTTASPYRAVSLDLLSNPSFDFLASDVRLSAGALSVDVAPGAGGGTPVATAVERRFFGIIGAAATIDTATLRFDAPGTGIGDVDNVTFYSVTDPTVTPPIPVPAALPLLLGGVAALAALRRRRAA